MTRTLHSISMITPPWHLPVSLADAKAHMRVDHSSEDVLITSLIRAAVELVQRRTRRQLMEAEFELAMDAFPPGSCSGGVIEIPMPPCQSIDSITYIDADGQQQTLPPEDYQVDIRPVFARVRPAAGGSWPATLPDTQAAVVVAFTAGYAEASSAPEMLKVAIKLLAAHWYEHREAVATVNVNEVPLAVETLLGMYTLPEVW